MCSIFGTKMTATAGQPATFWCSKVLYDFNVHSVVGIVTDFQVVSLEGLSRGDWRVKHPAA